MIVRIYNMWEMRKIPFYRISFSIFSGKYIFAPEKSSKYSVHMECFVVYWEHLIKMTIRQKGSLVSFLAGGCFLVLSRVATAYGR